MEFNPYKNIICSISKNVILLTNIKNLKKSKRFPNFQYYKSEKAYGVLPNINHSKYQKIFYYIKFKKNFKKLLEFSLKIFPFKFKVN